MTAGILNDSFRLIKNMLSRKGAKSPRKAGVLFLKNLLYSCFHSNDGAIPRLGIPRLLPGVESASSRPWKTRRRE